MIGIAQNGALNQSTNLTMVNSASTQLQLLQRQQSFQQADQFTSIQFSNSNPSPTKWVICLPGNTSSRDNTVQVSANFCASEGRYPETRCQWYLVVVASRDVKVDPKPIASISQQQNMLPQAASVLPPLRQMPPVVLPPLTAATVGNNAAASPSTYSSPVISTAAVSLPSLKPISQLTRTVSPGILSVSDVTPRSTHHSTSTVIAVTNTTVNTDAFATKQPQQQGILARLECSSICILRFRIWSPFSSFRTYSGRQTCQAVKDKPYWPSCNNLK
ncbi:hypothetical protein BSL78_19577 [Apostichopus japonicus]|uniref:Uncharacterized protein n=1 Tax=Stichopus japonicus TaxID=307972 RepID=A0A2G8K6B1_STIJA|nr:hypothetical protein BSL78_19577 [Apostichopus japonicus]